METNYWKQFKRTSTTTTTTVDWPRSSASENPSKIFSISNRENEVDRILYPRHTNLDAQQLSLPQRLHLTRIRYSTPKIAARNAFILFCFGWFLFSSILLLVQYMSFETVVYIEYENPTHTVPPAFSICTHCIYCS